MRVITDHVLLLPGWGTPPERMEPMADALAREGAPARVWSYTPAGSFDELVDHFAVAARAAVRMHEPEDRLHLVGHSLGGLVAAATALRMLAGEVASVTTVNAPWRGTWVSYTGTGALARSLRWRSPTLATLRADLDDHLDDPVGPRWLLLSAAGDLATPATTSLTAAAATPRLRRRVVPAGGHSICLMAPRVIGAVRDHVLQMATAPSWTWRRDDRMTAEG